MDLRFLDRLVEHQLISRAQADSARFFCDSSGEPPDEVLVNHGMMDETSVLKAKAQIYRSKYVSTEKLAKVKVPPAVLAHLPQRIAEKLEVIPILFDDATQTLTVCAADMALGDLEQELRLVTGLRSFQILVARTSAIRAAIRKLYMRDPNAFMNVLAEVNRWSNWSGSRTSKEAPATALPSLEPARQISLDPPQQMPSVVMAIAPEQVIPLQRHLESLHIFTALLDNHRQGLQGHTAYVVRLCRRMSERAGLSDEQRHIISAAAYLHDVGKPASHHLTALNVGITPDYKRVAERAYNAPLRLFETIADPGALRIIEHLYERFDGTGFPSRLNGSAIPFGSRILSVAESFVDLTANALNHPTGRILGTDNALNQLNALAGSVFDPAMLEILRMVVGSDDLRTRLLQTRQSALLVDTDPEETIALELALLDQGFESHITRNATDAIEVLRARDIDLVVLELDLQGLDGFALLAAIQELPKSNKPVCVVLTRHGDKDAVQRSFDAGAADFIVKPISSTTVAAKVSRLVAAEQKANASRSGVRGSLDEMPLVDLVQTLFHGRKTASITLESSELSGAAKIVIEKGQVRHAECEESQGTDALFRLFQIKQAQFSVLKDEMQSPVTIHDATDALLLEAMRHLDEATNH